MEKEILGVRFHDVTMAQALEQGQQWLLEESTAFHLVATANPEFVFMAQKNAQFRQTLAEASFVLPDGIGVIFASRILGRGLQSRVAGIDFATGILDILNKQGGSVFLLGAKDGVAQKGAERLQAQFPHLHICGTHHGYFSQEEEQTVAEAIAKTKPDVVFACLGAPRQELFLAQWGETMGAKMGIGLGGALDVFAGTVKRAPVFWQNCHLEWFYRLCKEPKRIGRMAKLPLILVQAMEERCFGKVDWCQGT